MPSPKREAAETEISCAPAVVGPRLVYEYAVYYLGWALFGGVALLWGLPALILSRVLPRKRATTLGQVMIRTGFRSFVALMERTGVLRCDLGALDCLGSAQGLVIAANHPTLLDAVLAISRLPRVVCIVKAPIWDNPFLGGGARLAGYLRNDDGLLLTKRAVRAVTEGVPLLIFPEGTRTGEPPVAPFKGGFALIAAQARAPIQTVFIECSAPFLGKDWHWMRKPVFPVIYRARLGRRFEVPEDRRNFVAELEAYYRAQLAPPVPPPSA
jgi:1-acyl-sn-glycerol-3-phosphate acyltransferase